MNLAAAVIIGERLGRGSFGVVRDDELRAAGVHPSTTARLVALGTWQRLWRGMYLCAARPVGALVRGAAAMKHADQRRSGARAQEAPALTGLAGAAAMGMRWVPEHVRVQVLVGGEVRRSSNEHVLVRRAWDLADIETWNWAGMRVVGAGRIVVDGSRECSSFRDVRGLAIAAVRDGLTSAYEIRTLLDAGAVGGTAQLRRALVDVDRGAASPPEAEVIEAMLGRRLSFTANAQVWVGELYIGCLDGYLLGTGVGWEVDSAERHGSSDLMSETLQRHERASEGQISLVHVTPTAFRADPGLFFARLHAAIRRRQADGRGEPPGLRLRTPHPLLR